MEAHQPFKIESFYRTCYYTYYSLHQKTSRLFEIEKISSQRLKKLTQKTTIIKTGEKMIYNTDNKTTLSEWMESDLPKNDIEYPVFEFTL